MTVTLGVLPTTHLAICNSRVLMPIQKAILKACMDVEDLDICCSHKADSNALEILIDELLISSVLHNNQFDRSHCAFPLLQSSLAQ